MFPAGDITSGVGSERQRQPDDSDDYISWPCCGHTTLPNATGSHDVRTRQTSLQQYEEMAAIALRESERQQRELDEIAAQQAALDDLEDSDLESHRSHSRSSSSSSLSSSLSSQEDLSELCCRFPGVDLERFDRSRTHSWTSSTTSSTSASAVSSVSKRRSERRESVRMTLIFDEIDSEEEE